MSKQIVKKIIKKRKRTVEQFTLSCPHCSKRCVTFAKYKNHIFVSHNEKWDKVWDTYNCSKCNLSFPQKGLRTRHETQCTIIPQEQTQTTKDSDKKEKNCVGDGTGHQEENDLNNSNIPCNHPLIISPQTLQNSNLPLPSSQDATTFKCSERSDSPHTNSSNDSSDEISPIINTVPPPPVPKRQTNMTEYFKIPTMFYPISDQTVDSHCPLLYCCKKDDFQCNKVDEMKKHYKECHKRVEMDKSDLDYEQRYCCKYCDWENTLKSQVIVHLKKCHKHCMLGLNFY